jgi:leader peptidase (prepilin peptidase)/N-methyltransferase
MAHLSSQEKLLVGLIFYSPAIIAFVFGTVIGSLSNVIIHRLVYYKSIWSPPSHCTSCGTEIPWYLNIPIVSYLWLRGRCRFCGATFSSRYFWVELSSGILYALVVLWAYTFPPPQGLGLTFREVFTFQFSGNPPLGFSPAPGGMILMFKGFLFCTFMLILGMIDLEHKLLPDRLTVPGIILGLILGVVAPLNRPALAAFGTHGMLDAFLQSFLGMLVGGGILLVIALVVPAGMGGGDVKLMAMVGAFVGVKALAPSMFLGFVIGGVIAVLLMMLGKARRGTMIPFGPFLALGGIIGLFWGQQIWAWYLHRFT